jgi:hypothetical protein
MSKLDDLAKVYREKMKVAAAAAEDFKKTREEHANILREKAIVLDTAYLAARNAQEDVWHEVEGKDAPEFDFLLVSSARHLTK